MPIKDWEKRKEYSRNLMRKRRSLIPVADAVRRIAVNVIPISDFVIPLAVVVSSCEIRT